MTEVRHIRTSDEQEQAYAIRHEVFVVEQQVPASEEIDEHEPIAEHYLALADGKAIGTARWRITEKGVKLERFAVLKEWRKSGAGRALLRKMLEDIHATPSLEKVLCYLHAQVAASGFYAKEGFTAKGKPFDECGIQHYYMYRQPED